ncbi:hypothetical protein M9H77_22476 [Catharanthus roseus]|uniref:Uncharacterized protein n=1 Tax=Catharanthus roseus TaxID=4058 RepID=A0ACC0AT76_CATRO|nr:hypothetical protein M9H77_22476 [Catharanthus roseus]
MEAFRFLEFDSCPNIIEAYEGWWKMISSRCFAASWTGVLKISLSSSIRVVVQSEPTDYRVRKIHLPHTRWRRQGDDPVQLPWKFQETQDNLKNSRDFKSSNNIGDSQFEVLISGSIQSGRDITYYIKYMENLTKSQLTIPKPQEILDALNKYFLSSHFLDTEGEQPELLDTINMLNSKSSRKSLKTLQVDNKKLGEIIAVTEQLTELESAFDDIKAERENELHNISKQDRRIAEIIKELKDAKLTYVCAHVAQQTQLYKIKFDELSIGKSHLVDDKEVAQEMYEYVIGGWAELVKQARDVLGDVVIA